MIINLVEIDHWWHIEHGLRSSDSLLRLWSARKVPLVLKGASLSQAVVLMKSDSFMPIRREALRTCVAVHADDTERTLEEALLDRSFTIRDEARFHLKKLGHADFAPVYRSAIRSDDSLVAAISGLGETGTKADAELILPYTSSSFPIQRRVSVRAIGKLSAEDHIDVLIGCLTDDSPKVASEARKMLQGQIHHIDPERIWNICIEDERLHVKLAALELLNEFSVWRSLPYFLQAAAEMEHRMSDRASVYIQMAVNRVFTKPTETERQKIQDALDRYKETLDGLLLKELRPWLRTVGGFDV